MRNRRAGTGPTGLVSLGALALLGSLLATPGACAEKDDSRFRVRGDLLSEYTDNLFHYSEQRVDEFDDRDDEGDRYFGLESPSDVVTRLRVRLDYRWNLREKQDLKVFLNASHFDHARNGIADYEEVSTGVEIDMAKRDRVEVALEHTFDRFKKNLKIASSDQFDAAFYDQTDALIGYTRRLGKEWYAGLDYAVSSRRFNAPFQGRDFDGDYLRLRTSYALGRSIDSDTSFSYGEIDSATEMDDGILIDRSYDEMDLSQAFDFRLGQGFHIGLDLELRRRDYTTDVEEDTGRHDRQDDYWRTGAEIGREWKNGLTLALRGEILDNDSDRIDPDVETDETGYRETIVGIDVGYRF